MTFIRRVEALLQKGEVRAAIEQLIAWLPGDQRDLRSEVIGHSAELSRIERLERLGSEGPDELARRRRRLISVLLGVLEEIERLAPRAQLPVDELPVSFQIPSSLSFEKIFKTSRLKGVSWLEEGLRAAVSICRIVTPDGVGTGFLVNGGYLFTNHHVIESPEAAARSFAEFNYQLSIEGHALPVTRYDLKTGSFFTDASLDYTLLRIEDCSPALQKWSALQIEKRMIPQVGDLLPIIQHPGGGPKQVGLFGNQAINLLGSRLQYLTDTLPGSSGAPVFNDSWRVVAIHHAGGSLEFNNRGDEWFINEGILLAHILGNLPRDVASLICPD